MKSVFPLMQHQVEGVEFLLDRRSGLLAFEQGLGKTLVAIEAFRRLFEAGTVESLVVVCPNSLKRNWAVEVQRFAPEFKTLIIEGDRSTRRSFLGGMAPPIVILNYETCRAEMMSVRALLLRRKSVLVLDEAHFVKNHESLAHIAANNLAPATEYRWLLTGTPVTNSPEDLAAQMAILGQEAAVGVYQSRGDREWSATDRSALAKRAAPYLMRRTKEQCLDLPEKTVVDIEIELPEWQRKLYDAMRDDLITEVEQMTDQHFRMFTTTALTRVLRLSQLASNPSILFPEERRTPGKFAELDTIVGEIVSEPRRKVIVWSYYVKSIDALSERYGSYGALTLYGGTVANSRQDVAQRFQEDPEARVLVANPAAAGSGFNFTAATYAVYETLSWRYDQYSQSQERNHRIGQALPTTLIRLLAADTIEGAIAEALARKSRLARELVGDTDVEPLGSTMSRKDFILLLRTGVLPGSS